ncbi:alpha/beta fold hydrolase [Streptomyces sp. GD-15H]|uniref:thioesterase II family protein n=1 Tax=Streptomyces sp. GD-15H TaxID=3129112 RepID=UPI003254A961
MPGSEQSGPAAEPGGAWLRRLPGTEGAGGLRLFCFPYAGAGASVFRGWGADLPEDVEAFGVQPPGREDRFHEPPFTSVDALLDALLLDLLPYLDRPFAFFGHSMGALICWEAAQRLRSMRAPSPVRIIVSGCRAPHRHKSHAPADLDLSEAGLIDKLRRLNGTPEELLHSADFRRFLLPTFRADVQLFATYAHRAEHSLNCPVTAFGGIEDPRVREDQIRAWGDLTTGPCDVRMFPGGHLFLNETRASVVRAVARALTDAPRSAARSFDSM